MEFFKFFTGFVDSIMKSMPKEEKKKKEAPAVAGGAKKFSDAPASSGSGGPGAGLKNNLMAELKMKQQAPQKWYLNNYFKIYSSLNHGFGGIIILKQLIRNIKI